jgi:hypothetical protein
MVEYMTDVSKKGEELAKEKFDDALKELGDMIENLPPELCRPSIDKNDALVMEDGSWDEDDLCGHQDDDGKRPSDSAVEELVERLSHLKEELELYCSQMTCLGFNSSKYDMNLVKSYLTTHINMYTDNVFTVKRNNQTQQSVRLSGHQHSEVL